MNADRLIRIVMRYAMRYGMKYFAKKQRGKDGPELDGAKQAMKVGRRVGRF
ncbi:MAG: hypothetical protein GKR98_04355 [Boseongicola sp.]|nr:MAG: hypothetical protein GKR98_04355 [Boseongicola sp.]